MVNTGMGGGKNEICFECAKAVEIPYVVWHGTNKSGWINLHIECAKKLALHLGKDAIECEVAVSKLKKGFVCKVCWKIKDKEEKSDLVDGNICLNCALDFE